ncbi:MAG: galactosyltransferase-related protein [Pedococcus sp.]
MTAARRTAVITIAHGRHEHLRGQQWGLARQTAPPDLHVVVAMGDPEVALVAHEGLHERCKDTRVVTVDLDVAGEELPLSHARNLGAQAAMDAGADRLVFLDVDCIPAAGTLARYATVLDASAQDAALLGPVVVCGTVAYLPPVAHPRDYRIEALAELAPPHPARPVPADGQVVVGADLRLFWSLSFALTAASWQQLGGFSEDYVGYGAEDTDFGQRLGAAKGTMLWAGGAAAYHQHHPSQTPPVRHLTSIIRNANVFRDRWGWFPMEGWLTAFAERGLARRDPATGRWVVTT